jgi:hypothetical protein
VVASTGKDRMLRLLDRDSTDILYSVPFTNRINAEAPVSTTPVRVCPASLGGQEWNGSAYHVKLNVLVAPATDWCAEFKKYLRAGSGEGTLSRLVLWRRNEVRSVVSRARTTHCVRCFHRQREVALRCRETAGGRRHGDRRRTDFHPVN